MRPYVRITLFWLFIQNFCFQIQSFAPLIKFQENALEYVQSDVTVLKEQSFDDLMMNLLADIRSAQAKQDQDYSPRKLYPPLKWQKQAGIYDSFVHVNFNGQLPQSALLRNLYKFPDDNGFVTMFILEALINAQQFYPKLNIQDDELLPGVQAVAKHKDLNVNDSVPLFNFWNQEKVEGGYRAVPPNIAIPLSELNSGLRMVEQGLKSLHLDKYADLVKSAVLFEESFGAAFRIPADSDDTGCNLALGMQLLSFDKRYPFSNFYWKQKNKNPENLFPYYLQFSYQPFSGSYPSNAIDPRTYLWIRKFLEEKKGDSKLKIITTWMQSVDQVESQWNYRRMPFNINNVDLSVVANAIFGFTQLFLNKVRSNDMYFINTEIEKLYVDNIDLLVWSLKNRIVEIYSTNALLYYPPKFAFYWFVSRIIFALRNFDDNKNRLPKFLGKSLEKLKLAMNYYGQNELLKQVNCDDSICHWDDFLGQGDYWKEKKSPRYEDRVFSTALALNSLIDSNFVTKQKGQDLSLVFDGPKNQKIVQILKKGFKFLKSKANQFPKENAFFSASVKGGVTTPVYFPHNSFMWINGTSAGNCADYDDAFKFGISNVGKIVASVTGFVDDKQYKTIRENQICFQKKVPEFIDTVDLSKAAFPYWSSPALTNAFQLVAMAKLNAAEF